MVQFSIIVRLSLDNAQSVANSNVCNLVFHFFYHMQIHMFIICSEIMPQNLGEGYESCLNVSLIEENR